MQTILYVGRFGLPDTAPGLRVYNVSEALSLLGRSVTFLSTMGISYGQAETAECGGRKYIFTNRCKYKNRIIRTAANLIELLAARKAYRAIREYCRSEKPEGIILYNDLYPLTKNLIGLCAKNGILLYADVTEWYEKRKYHKLGDFIIPHWTDKRIRKLDRKLDGVVAISTYLAEYYRSIGCKNVICVPPLFEVEKDIKIERHPYGGVQTVNLVYAGSPGSKDILTPVFDALESINRNSVKVRFDLIGLKEDQLHSLWKKADLPARGIYAHGRLSHTETIKIVRRADFGILLRENKRYAKAGYSTKFAECMANGVAMICNKLGGTDNDIIDGFNGFLVDSCSVDEIINVLDHLCGMDSSNLLTMKNNAHEFALVHYWAADYVSCFKSLFAKG